jgi:streptogramin lyase
MISSARWRWAGDTVTAVSGCFPGLRPGRLAHDVSRRRDGGVRSSAARALAVLLAVLAGGLASTGGSARAANVQLFAVPTAGVGLSNIVAGPDGALWFNEQTGFAIGQITTTGAVTEFPVPRAPYSADGDGPTTIVSSGGNLWTLANVGSTIDAISTAGAVTQLYANLSQSATNLAPDSAGGVWAASLAGAGGGSVSGGLFRVDPPDGAIRNYRNPQFTGQFQPVPLLAGPNGTAWFADGGTAISEINNAGKITRIPIRRSGSMLVTSIAFDRKGDLWFTEYVPGGGFLSSTKGAVGEIPAGSRTATLTRLPGNETPGSMILGSDGGIWFTWSQGIGRLATQTGAVQLVKLGAAYHPSSIAFGSDRNLWFVDPQANDIGQVQVAQLAVGTRTPLPTPIVGVGPGGLATIAADRQLALTCRLSAPAECAVTATLPAATARRLKLEPNRGPHPIALGTETATARKRGTVKLTISLTPAIAAALARYGAGAVPVTLTAKATIVTGRSARVTRTVTLRG